MAIELVLIGLLILANGVFAMVEMALVAARSNRLETLDWAQVMTDVRPFLDSSTDLDLLTRENVMRVLIR